MAQCVAERQCLDCTSAPPSVSARQQGEDEDSVLAAARDDAPFASAPPSTSAPPSASARQQGEDDDSVLAAALVITGAGSEEELSEYELERFRSLAAHPLSLNRAPRSRLLSSGLFSAYQAAVIEDTRSREGAILSAMELSTLEGFNLDLARAVAVFVSFDASGAPASPLKRAGAHYVSNDLTLRTGVKLSVSTQPNSTSVSTQPNSSAITSSAVTKLSSVSVSSGAKYRLDIDDCWSIALASSGGGLFTPAASKSSGYDFSASVCYESPWKRHRLSLSRVVVGDFNMRFGQGLAMWSGMSMSGLANVSAFSRNPTGIVPYRSYSGSSVHRGAAFALDAGRFSMSAALSLPHAKDGISYLPLVNVGYLGRMHQEGVTAYFEISPEGKCLDAKVSADFRANVRGVDLFGEAAFDLSALRSAWNAFALVCGTRFKLGDRLSLAALVRRYPSEFGASRSGAVRSSTKCTDEHGVALAARLRGGGYVAMKPVHLLDVSMDAAFRPDHELLQVNALADYVWRHGEHWETEFRARYKLRCSGFLVDNFRNIGSAGKSSSAPGFEHRTELRADLRWDSGTWNASARIHGLYGDAPAVLAYAEGGYRHERKSMVMRLFLRAGGYSTRSWNDRIYVYERDFPGSFNVPAMYGRGWWLSALGDVKLSRTLKLGFRYGMVNMERHEFKFFLNLSFDKKTGPSI